MFGPALLLAAAAINSQFAFAQNGTETCSYSTSGNLTFDPGCIDLSLRQAWCRGERNTCDELCTDGVQGSDGNQCDANALTYACTCQDGTMPNMTAYDQSLPAAMCRQWKTFCTNAHPDDLDGQTACQSVECGTQLTNETEASTGSSSSSSSSGSGSATTTSGSSDATDTAASTTSGSPSETSASGTATSATSTGAAAALRFGSSYGAPVLGAGLLALFGLAL